MTRMMAARTFGVLGLALLLPVFLCQPAAAQSDADLRKQNQELQARVKDLETELAAARGQNESLQKRITALEAALAARPAAPGAVGGAGAAAQTLPEERVTIDESKPAASPRALFNAVVESYKTAMGDAPVGKHGDRDRAAYMRRLQKWEGASEREFRMPVEWHVRVLPARMMDNARERMASFVAVDPVTDTRLGDAFDVVLSRQLAARLAELTRVDESGVLVLKGTSAVNLSINENRLERGSFDSPRFVGPFAEYEFTVEPSGLAPVRPAPATQPATAPAK
jgi:hypothetical protein